MKNETLKLTFDEVEAAYKIDNTSPFMCRDVMEVLKKGSHYE